MKKIAIIPIIFTTCLFYVPMSGTGFRINSSFKTPVGVEIGLEDGNTRGGILMPGKTLEIDTKLSAITSLKFSEGCGADVRIFEGVFRFPPKHGIVELRLSEDGNYDIIADKWGRFQALLIYGKK
jgi:hypothetical protein